MISHVEIQVIVTTNLDGEPQKRCISVSSDGDLSNALFRKQLEYDTSCLLVTISTSMREAK